VAFTTFVGNHPALCLQNPIRLLEISKPRRSFFPQPPLKSPSNRLAELPQYEPATLLQVVDVLVANPSLLGCIRWKTKRPPRLVDDLSQTVGGEF